MTRRMVGAVRNPRTNVLGHCTGRMVMGDRGTRRQSQFDARAVFEACVEHDVAVEINSRPERRDPPTKLLELARDLGCLFSIDSDAHAPGQLDFLGYGASGPRRPASTPTGSSTRGRSERLLEWANGARFRGMTRQLSERGPRVEVRRSASAAGAPSRPTATATRSSC